MLVRSSRSGILILIFAGVLTSISFIDNIIGQFYLGSYENREKIAIPLFLMMTATNMICQFIILVLFQKLNKSYQNPNFLKYLSIAILSSLIIYSTLSILLSHSIIFFQHYSLTLFIISIISSLLSSAGILSILVIKFMRWYMNNRNLSLVLFSFTFILFYIGVMFGLAAILNEADNRTSLVISTNPWDKTSLKTSSYMNIFSTFSYFVFGLTWLATSLFLKRYIVNYFKNREKYYWLIVSLPLLFYLTSTPLMNGYFNNFVNQNPSYLPLVKSVIGLTQQISGFYFSLLFIFMAIKVSNNNLRISLLITAAGVLMLYSSMQISIILLIPFPPFGLMTFSLMPLSAFLIYTGLYTSSLTISNDTDFLRELREKVKYKSSLLMENIGSAEWKIQLEKTVGNMVTEIGLQENKPNTNLSYEDISSYLDEVLTEIKNERMRED